MRHQQHPPRGANSGPNVNEIITKSAEHIREGRPLDHLFLVEWPRAIAQAIGQHRTAAQGQGTTALRRLYDHVAALNFRLKMDPQATEVVQTGLPKLRRFAEYQKNRKIIKPQTAKWIEEHSKAVGDDLEKFRAFYEFFQSVMAYLPRN